MVIETIILLVVGRQIAKICERKGHEPKKYVIWTGVLCISGGLIGLGFAFWRFGFHLHHGWNITLITLVGLLIGVALSFLMAYRLEDLTLQKEPDSDKIDAIKAKIESEEANQLL